MLTSFPEEWQIVTGSEFVVDPKSDIVDGPFGSNLKASEYTDSGIPIARIQNVKRFNFVDKNIRFVTTEKAEELHRHSFVRGDILITKLGDPLGLACEVPESFDYGIIVADLVRLRPNLKVCAKPYLIYLLNSDVVIKQIEIHVKGTTRPRINLGVIRNLSLPLAPLAEQKIIADKLDTLLAQVETTKARLERIPEILKNFRQSVLAAAVSGKLLERKTKWNTEVLRNCFDCIDGDRGPNYPKKNDYQSEGYCLFLSTKNVRQFGFDFKETVFISKEKDSILRKGKLERGDLVITTRGTLGYVASYDNSVQYDVARINSGMLILRKKDPSFVNDYFKILIASPYFQKLIEKNRTGSAQPQLPAKILKEFELPVPPSEEQAEIVFRVDQLFNFADSIEQKANAALERVNNLSQSILTKAFSGELTIDWRAANPELISGENSAEALLEKIKAEREALKPVKKSSVRKKS